jgi:four helix bundle protein
VASYEDTALYKLAKQMAVELHQVTLNELPKFEMYEQGSQIRRSSKSIVANFVEGYGRRRYNNYRKIGAMLYNLRQSVIKGNAC